MDLKGQVPAGIAGILCIRSCCQFEELGPRCDKTCAFGHLCQNIHSRFQDCGPCWKKVTVTLDCGHKLEYSCCNGPVDLQHYKCTQPCAKRYPICGHRCNKPCFEFCGACEEYYPRVNPNCRLGLHTVFTKCHNLIKSQCEVLVKASIPAGCGHDVMVPCFRDTSALTPSDLAKECTVQCIDAGLSTRGKNDCGHACYGDCRTCHQGRFHVTCETACGRMLVCGHFCAAGCPVSCPPCSAACVIECDHDKCPFECGVPCAYDCEEPCNYSCEHFRCSMKCSEVCNRAGCEKPCSKVLPCGHPCVGFCGELCPDACRVCSPEKLQQGMIGGNEVEEDTRFIQLPACGHVIEEFAISSWINAEDDSGEIHLKWCPICFMPIGLNVKRYSARLHSLYAEFQKVRLRIFGDIDKMYKIRRQIFIDFRTLADSPSPIRFFDFSTRLWEELQKPVLAKQSGERMFESLYLLKAEFLSWLTSLWIKAETNVNLAYELWEKPYPKRLKHLHQFIFDVVQSRQWPLHRNETSALSRELARVSDAELLYSRLGSDIDEKSLALAKSPEGMAAFLEAEKLLFALKPYDKTLQKSFREKFALFMCVQNHTLRVSESEKQEIVKAFGPRPGRWFKCPNGHIYVVTECGGATQVAVCNECGESIGGAKHMLLHHNQLATEMDGALEPLYPTALNRDN